MHKSILRVIRKEPVVITGAVATIIGVLMSFEIINWSEGQTESVMVSFGVVMMLVRQLVTPTIESK